jgi:carboxymethylenebutenolidase
VGEYIKVASDGGEMHSYVVLPKKPNGGGIVLASAVWGLGPDLIALADSLAELGYAVLAPNLFWRLQPVHAMEYDFTHIGFVTGLADSGSDAEGLLDLRNAKAELVKRSGAKRVAAMGWCYGGRLVCLIGTEKTFDATIGMYPTYLEKHLHVAKDIVIPMNIHLPEEERYGTIEHAVEKMVEAFEKNPLVQTYVYPGVNHGFDFAEPHPHANHTASRLCDMRIIRYLDAILVRGEQPAA